MKRAYLLFSMVMVLGTVAIRGAQSPVAFPLWPDGAPGALGTSDKDIPTLTPWLPEPETATGAAIVICPGGGYAGLASHEGADYARFLNEQGIAAFVLKYRVRPDPERGMAAGMNPAVWGAILSDGQRAVRTVRARAAELLGGNDLAGGSLDERRAAEKAFDRVCHVVPPEISDGGIARPFGAGRGARARPGNPERN
mgnify:CR=1 FL=1